MNGPQRVLALQPYFGVSHSRFHAGWVEHSSFDWTTLTLPPRHWKWRMRHASIHFAKQIRELINEAQAWDAIFCTDMMNVAEFKGLVAADPILAPSLGHLPIVLYFHENQYAYPVRQGYKRDEHLAFSNFMSALAADRIWFNSQFNFDSMMDGLTSRLDRWPDFGPSDEIATLAAKMQVQPPGIASPLCDIGDCHTRRTARAENGQPMHIVWAARWEHDKNVDDLLAALKILEQEGVPFRLSVLGQSFRYSPTAFAELQERYPDRIVRWGYQKSRQDYWNGLAEGDLFVSTAKHEFFGLAAAEAIAAGLRPVFPDRLAYPELLGHAVDAADVDQFLFGQSAAELANKLIEIHGGRIELGTCFGMEAARQIIQSVGWQQRAPQLDLALADVCELKSSR